MSRISTEELLTLSRLLRIVHHVPGRLRVRLSKDILRHSSTVSLDEIRNIVDKIDGVRSLRVSPVTLSAIIEYDPSVIAPHLWDSLIGGPEHSARNALETLTRPAKTAQE